MDDSREHDEDGPGWWGWQIANGEDDSPPPSPSLILEGAIEASGLSARKFATEILLRDERTIRRWLAGDSPIPEAVMRFLEKKD
jgi:hypothetical protein